MTTGDQRAYAVAAGVVPARGLTSRAIRSPVRSSSVSKSYCACRLVQKRALVPKYRASLSAVSAVMALSPRTMSYMRGAGTPISCASLYEVIPKGSRNSSASISPGCIGSKTFL